MNLKFPTKLLLLGGDGMLGSAFPAMYEDLIVVKAFRKDKESTPDGRNILGFENIYNFDPFDLVALEKVILKVRPSFIINCIGWVKQREETSLDKYVRFNAILPWMLDGVCSRHNITQIAFSTDCVFSGVIGNYSENSVPDATDLYGKTKQLGEVFSGSTLNLRTSFFGLESYNKFGLIEWFLSQKGEIKGYKNAVYSGILSKFFAIDVLNLIKSHSDLRGLWHISSTPISKYQILSELKDRLKLKDVTIVPDDIFKCDRSLDCSKLIHAVGYKQHCWNEMLDVLCVEILSRK